MNSPATFFTEKSVKIKPNCITSKKPKLQDDPLQFLNYPCDNLVSLRQKIVRVHSIRHLEHKFQAGKR